MEGLGGVTLSYTHTLCKTLWLKSYISISIWDTFVLKQPTRRDETTFGERIKKTGETSICNREPTITKCSYPQSHMVTELPHGHKNKFHNIHEFSSRSHNYTLVKWPRGATTA